MLNPTPKHFLVHYFVYAQGHGQYYNRILKALFYDILFSKQQKLFQVELTGILTIAPKLTNHKIEFFNIDQWQGD